MYQCYNVDVGSLAALLSHESCQLQNLGLGLDSSDAVLALAGSVLRGQTGLRDLEIMSLGVSSEPAAEPGGARERPHSAAAEHLPMPLPCAEAPCYVFNLPWHLRHLTQLTLLSLTWTVTTEEVPFHDLSRLTGLRSLTLDGRFYEDDGMFCCPLLPPMPRLEHLSLRDMISLHTHDGRLFKWPELTAFTALTSLSLGSTVHHTPVADMPHLRRLEYIGFAVADRIPAGWHMTIRAHADTEFFEDFMAPIHPIVTATFRGRFNLEPLLFMPALHTARIKLSSDPSVCKAQLLESGHLLLKKKDNHKLKIIVEDE